MGVFVDGATAPFREAVVGAMRSLDETWFDGAVAVYVTVCTSEADWESVAERSQDPDAIVVAVLVDLDASMYARALRLGVSGVVYADTSAAIIASVVRSAIGGEIVLPNFVARVLAASANDPAGSVLSSNERAVVRAVASGLRVREVADQLSYTERTIRRFLQNAMLKLGVRSRADLVRYVVEHPM